MNDPTRSSPDFRRLSELNRSADESCLIHANYDGELNTSPFPQKVYVLNLPEREDRWQKFCESNGDLFEEFEVIRFQAIKGQDVQESIFTSFLTCLKSCPDETCIIMEDDAYLADGGIDQIKKTWSLIPEDWEVVFGNHYFFTKLNILDRPFACPIGRASTANFGIYHQRLIPKIEKSSFREDPSTREWDHLLTGDPEIKNYLYWPMISREHPGYSDHRGKIMDINLRTREHRCRYNFIDNEKFYERIWKT
jgi:GR25 family glycosyltransferase involved in LPS biosynthesis